MTVNAVKSLAIVDTGAGVSIITKETWVKWGKLALQSTRMGLQLAYGKIKYPLGLIKDVHIKIYDIQFEHSFVVVDFDQETSYEVILGRPFMRQLLVVQDWGYNCLYLCHNNSIVWVNLGDHSYRDVIKTPVEDFESTTYDLVHKNTSDTTSEEGAWMCNLFEKASDLKEMDHLNRHVEEELYVPQPFSSMEIDEHWDASVGND